MPDGVDVEWLIAVSDTDDGVGVMSLVQSLQPAPRIRGRLCRV